jgi:hypothetical protein
MRPFQVLGLPPSGEISDDDVRAAWRRLAAATHPDRADGGDPAAFAAAAAAYTALRTASGRLEVLAGQREPVRGVNTPVPGRKGLSWRLLTRLLAAVAAGALSVAVIGWQPASLGVITGALTWAIVTGRRDLGGWRRE